MILSFKDFDLLGKGERTKNKILRDAMAYASSYGLSSVTIGEISKMTKMSRTGVISHFKSKEDMQISILKYSENEFREKVIKPSIHENSLVSLKQYFNNWANWVDGLGFDRKASCPFIKAMNEYQDREDSVVKEHIQRQQKRLIEYLSSLVKACKEEGYFKPEVDPYNFAFQVYSFYLGHNVAKNLIGIDIANQRVHESVSKLINNSLS